MPSITLELTDEQTARVMTALRQKYALDEEAMALTDMQLSLKFLRDTLHDLVLTQERSVAEDELLANLNKTF